jgi:hypothetical protein
MAEEKENSRVTTDTGDARLPKIVWDDTGMNSSYANVCNVASTREEVILFFGMNQNWHGGQKEVTVKLSDRVILSPHAARRLMALLGNVLREYETRFGPLTENRPAAQ